MSKYKDFETALSFLLDYGFEYCSDINNRKCYKNEYGELMLYWKMIDYDYGVPKLLIKTNYNESIIDVDKEYLNLGKKRTIGFYDMLYYVIKAEIETNYKIFNLNINIKNIEKMKQVYTYEYSYDKEYIFNKLKKANDYRIVIKDEYRFMIGLEATHSGGFWYVANIEEVENKQTIFGQIIHNPDEDGKPRKVEYKTKDKIKDGLIIAVMFIILWWLLLIIWICGSIYSLFTKKKEELTKEQKLDKFMTEYLCCKKKED
ncbi:MAG: hypothetical protein E7183_01845 [Erysipelotrichaceae bacterium]|nr:hypothetical protein [Erysipelotrichaceae bacterium]